MGSMLTSGYGEARGDRRGVLNGAHLRKRPGSRIRRRRRRRGGLSSKHFPRSLGFLGCPACLARRSREEKALGAADEGIAAFVEAKELIGGTRDTDSNGLADGIDWPICASDPHRARRGEGPPYV